MYFFHPAHLCLLFLTEQAFNDPNRGNLEPADKGGNCKYQGIGIDRSGSEGVMKDSHTCVLVLSDKGILTSQPACCTLICQSVNQSQEGHPGSVVVGRDKLGKRQP